MSEVFFKGHLTCSYSIYTTSVTRGHKQGNEIKYIFWSKVTSYQYFLMYFVTARDKLERKKLKHKGKVCN